MAAVYLTDDAVERMIFALPPTGSPRLRGTPFDAGGGD
jgi:hypothetical protein